MKTKFYIVTIFSILILFQGCKLEMEEFTKITPDNFYKTEKDAQLAIAALYSWSFTDNFFTASPYYGMQNISDISAGDMSTCSYQDAFERLRNHEYNETNGQYSESFFRFYNQISSARIVIKELEQMDISESIKKSFIAEANAIAGWKAYLLFDFYGPLPHPTDEMLENSSELVYPTRPSTEEYVTIIENFFSMKNDLMEPDFASNFGRVNKGIVNMVLMKLYMQEAARTGDASFWTKAKSRAEEIIGSGVYELQDNYSDVFTVANKRSREIVYASPVTYEFNGNSWHAEALPNNYPAKINRTVGAWGGHKLLWSFYDTFNQNDLRLSGIAAEYTTDAGLVINRENPYDSRHGLGTGPIPVKYGLDDNMVGGGILQDLIVYRYADVLLSMAEILNELGTNANVNAPVMTQVGKDGSNYQSDGGNTAFSFVNAVRVRAGLVPFTALSKEQLRDSILQERAHELYCEGSRRRDLIRYQMITNGQGYKKFDDETHKFLFPIPVSFINEYRGNISQNPGY